MTGWQHTTDVPDSTEIQGISAIDDGHHHYCTEALNSITLELLLSSTFFHYTMTLPISPTATYVLHSTSKADSTRWDTIENVFYRKEDVYQMSWKVPDLSDYLVAVGKNGGPIGELNWGIYTVSQS